MSEATDTTSEYAKRRKRKREALAKFRQSVTQANDRFSTAVNRGDQTAATLALFVCVISLCEHVLAMEGLNDEEE